MYLHCCFGHPGEADEYLLLHVKVTPDGAGTCNYGTQHHASHQNAAADQHHIQLQLSNLKWLINQLIKNNKQENLHNNNWLIKKLILIAWLVCLQKTIVHVISMKVIFSYLLSTIYIDPVTP